MRLPTPVSSYFSRLRSGVAGDPVRDWLILLTLWVLALVCLIVWNIAVFDEVANGGTFGTSATSTPAVFNRSSIDTIDAIFQNRVIEESKYVTGVYRYVDPSQ
jgi:hypothetical protein